MVSYQELAGARETIRLTAAGVERRQVSGDSLAVVLISRVETEPSETAAGEAVVAVAAEEPHSDQALQHVVAQVGGGVGAEGHVSAVLTAVADELEGDLLTFRRAGDVVGLVADKLAPPVGAEADLLRDRRDQQMERTPEELPGGIRAAMRSLLISSVLGNGIS